MLAESLRADVTANNLANVNTSGFKKDFAILRDYASNPVRRVNDGSEQEVGSIGSGSWLDTIATSHSQGMMRTTDNSFDFALEGKGYFAVQTPAGIRYTRNGTFTRNSTGDLINQDGYQVLGQSGPINLDPAGQAGKVNVSEDGRVFLDDIENSQFQFYSFADESRLSKEGANLFRPPADMNAETANPIIHQGMLELSNVNVITEMVNMIAGQRAYDTNSKMIWTQDELLDKAVNEVAKV